MPKNLYKAEIERKQNHVYKPSFKANYANPIFVHDLSCILCPSSHTGSNTSTGRTWTTTVTKEDILRVIPDFHQEALCDNSGTFVMTFNADGTFTVDQTPLSECQGQTSWHLESKWSATGNLITMDKDTPDEGVYEFDINGDRLTLKAQSSNCPPCIAVNTVNPWTRVE